MKKSFAQLVREIYNRTDWTKEKSPPPREQRRVSHRPRPSRRIGFQADHDAIRGDFEAVMGPWAFKDDE